MGWSLCFGIKFECHDWGSCNSGGIDTDYKISGVKTSLVWRDFFILFYFTGIVFVSKMVRSVGTPRWANLHTKTRLKELELQAQKRKKSEEKNPHNSGKFYDLISAEINSVA